MEEQAVQHAAVSLADLSYIGERTLMWVGFGTLAGLLAKAIMPGRDPGGTVSTLMMGIVGSVIGSGVLTYFSKDTVISPITPLGFVVATAGAFVLLFFYRLLGGHIIDEGKRVIAPQYIRRRRRRRYDNVYDD
ncbi:MAG: GlsB/YeaQ/YmgE family stress response membrane protein [Pirellulales bacterium]